MEARKLVASPRSVTGKKVGALRREGQIPAVLYGRGIESTALQLEEQALNRVLAHVGSSSLIDLVVDKDTHKVLVRDVQREAIRRDILHVDFLRVEMDILIRAQVPVELVGEAPAVKEHGGVLVTNLMEIEVEALPADLPDRITIDIEQLEEIDDAITVGELSLGGEVKILNDPEETIVRVIFEMVEEEEEEEELELEVAEPEVIERGRREEEEEDQEE